MIESADIQEDRVSYIVHLENEDKLFFTVPMENDGSDNWNRLQAWLDEGNEISDRLEWRTMYASQRRISYPSIEDQLDDIFHNGIDAWKATIQAVKDEYPKPEE